MNIEVVQCKDCKYYTPYEWGNIYLDSGCDKLIELINGDTQGSGCVLTEPDDYCSYGVKKGE